MSFFFRRPAFVFFFFSFPLSKTTKTLTSVARVHRHRVLERLDLELVVEGEGAGGQKEGRRKVSFERMKKERTPRSMLRWKHHSFFSLSLEGAERFSDCELVEKIHDEALEVAEGATRPWERKKAGSKKQGKKSIQRKRHRKETRGKKKSKGANFFSRSRSLVPCSRPFSPPRRLSDREATSSSSFSARRKGPGPR